MTLPWPALTTYHNVITVDGTNVESLTPEILKCITEPNPKEGYHWSMMEYNINETFRNPEHKVEDANYDNTMGFVLPNGTLLTVTGIVTLRNLARTIVAHYRAIT